MGRAPRGRHLYLARWPDGHATLLSASCLEEVADLLDEVGDPGECEVTTYDGPVCISIRPSQEVERGYLEIAEDTFEEHDARLALLEAAFPLAHAAVLEGRAKDVEPPYVDQEQWAAAVVREDDRDLQPSPEWAAGITRWWESMSGPADRTAALRDMVDVTIPGEPKPETEAQRAMFRAEQKRAMQRVSAALTAPKSAKPTTKKKSKKAAPKSPRGKRRR